MLEPPGVIRRLQHVVDEALSIVARQGNALTKTTVCRDLHSHRLLDVIDRPGEKSSEPDQLVKKSQGKPLESGLQSQY
jgi:hypothetical protein